MARTLKQQIRKTIKQHYGEDLWSFRADVNYGEATESFVTAISEVLKGRIEYCSDWQCDLAKYDKAGPLEAEIGKRLREVRVHNNLTLEEVAAKVGVCSSFLDNHEQGKIVADIGIFIKVRDSLRATRKQRSYITGAFGREIPVEDRIKDAINLHYGLNLWALRPQFEYEESIAPFVQALAGLDKTGRRAAMPVPTMPSLGHMIEIEERRRKIMSEQDNSPKVREAFEVHLSRW
jgi:transcriptional regulator with XRE-family HTH domain